MEAPVRVNRVAEELQPLIDFRKQMFAIQIAFQSDYEYYSQNMRSQIQMNLSGSSGVNGVLRRSNSFVFKEDDSDSYMENLLPFGPTTSKVMISSL